MALNRQRIRWLAIYLVCSFVVLFEKIKFPLLDPRHEGPLWDPWHAKAMANTIGAPLQYRVLSYLLPEIPHRLGLSVFDSYLLVRFLCLVAMGALLHALWRPWLRREHQALAGLLLFYLIYMASTLPMPQPAEPINVVIVIGCYLCLQRGKLAGLYLLVLLGALNKLTVVFVAPVVLFHLLLGAPRRDLRVWARAAGHGAALFLLAAGIRLAVLQLLGPRDYISSLWMFRQNLKWMGDTVAGWMFLLLVVAPMLLIWITWRRQPVLVRAHSLMLPLFVGSHFAITIMAEFRTQLMTLALTIPAVLAEIGPRAGAEAEADADTDADADAEAEADADAGADADAEADAEAEPDQA